MVTRTLDGSIELTIPTELSARLEASSGDGRVTSHLSRFEGTTRPSRLKGTVGSGRSDGLLILINTMDGRITLREH